MIFRGRRYDTGDRADYLHAVVRLASDGKLSPHVAAVYKASQIAEAHRLLESRTSVGKIVVEW